MVDEVSGNTLKVRRILKKETIVMVAVIFSIVLLGVGYFTSQNRIIELNQKLELEQNITQNALYGQNVTFLYGQALMADYICNLPANTSKEQLASMCSQAAIIVANFKNKSR